MKPEAIVYYNTNMGGVDRIDQQLHGIQVLRKNLQVVPEDILLPQMFSLLRSHKLYKSGGGKIGFLQFIYNVSARWCPMHPT